MSSINLFLYYKLPNCSFHLRFLLTLLCIMSVGFYKLLQLYYTLELEVFSTIRLYFIFKFFTCYLQIY